MLLSDPKRRRTSKRVVPKLRGPLFFIPAIVQIVHASGNIRVLNLLTQEEQEALATEAKYVMPFTLLILRVFPGTDDEWESFQAPPLQAPEASLLEVSENVDASWSFSLSEDDDDEIAEEKPEEKPERKITAADVPFTPVAGMRVSIYWKGIDRWEPGVIVRESVSQPNFWRINYDDGCKDCRPFKPAKWSLIE